jgi:hypothetical protein
MTKAELIAALQASDMEDNEIVFIYDMDNGTRHEIQKLDDSCGCLDLNCNDADFIDPEQEDQNNIDAQQKDEA